MSENNIKNKENIVLKLLDWQHEQLCALGERIERRIGFYDATDEIETAIIEYYSLLIKHINDEEFYINKLDYHKYRDHIDGHKLYHANMISAAEQLLNLFGKHESCELKHEMLQVVYNMFLKNLEIYDSELLVILAEEGITI